MSMEEKEKGKEQEKERTLYICFEEVKYGGLRSWVIQAINTSHLLAPCSPAGSSNSILRRVAYISGEQLPCSPGCGVFGSQILFAGGIIPKISHKKPKPNSSTFRGINRYAFQEPNRETYAFETDPSLEPNPEIKKVSLPSFTSREWAPFLMQAGDGKLYALGTGEGPPFLHNCPQCNPDQYYQLPQEEDCQLDPNFQVFDPRVGEWSPLPHQPFVYPCTCNRPTRFLSQAMGPSSYANAGSKIFVRRQNTPMYCFDVADPEKGWTKLSAYVPDYNSRGNALILNVNNNGDSSDGGLLMFSYTPTPSSRYRCSVFHHMPLSEDEEYNWKVIANWPLLDRSQLPTGFDLPTDCRFIHLGGRQVCLILTYFTCPVYDDCGIDYVQSEQMTIVLVTFEYQFTKTKESVSFSFKSLKPRIIEYHTNRAPKEDQKSHTCYANMIGAFLLDGVSVNGESNEEVTRMTRNEEVSSKAYKQNPPPVSGFPGPFQYPAARPIPHIPPPPSPPPILNNPAYPSTPHDFRAASLSSFQPPPVLPSDALVSPIEHKTPTQPSSFWPPPVPPAAALISPPTHYNPPTQILQPIYNYYFMAPHSSSIQTDHISAPLTSAGDHPRPTGLSSNSGPSTPTLAQPVQPLTPAWSSAGWSFGAPAWSSAGWSFGAPAGIVLPPLASTSGNNVQRPPSEAADYVD